MRRGGNYQNYRALSVPSHPPDINLTPWYPLTIRVPVPTDIYDITIGDIVTQLRVQTSGSLGVSAWAPTSRFNVRLLRARVWGPIPVTATPLSVSFYDLFDDLTSSGSAIGQETVLARRVSYANGFARTKLGFEWSTAQQAKSLYAIGGSTDAIVKVESGGLGGVIYLDLLWRGWSA